MLSIPCGEAACANAGFKKAKHSQGCGQLPAQAIMRQTANKARSGATRSPMQSIDTTAS